MPCPTWPPFLQAGRLVYLKLHLVQSRAARTVVASFLCVSVCVRTCARCYPAARLHCGWRRAIWKPPADRYLMIAGDSFHYRATEMPQSIHRRAACLCTPYSVALEEKRRQRGSVVSWFVLIQPWSDFHPVGLHSYYYVFCHGDLFVAQEFLVLTPGNRF